MAFAKNCFRFFSKESGHFNKTADKNRERIPGKTRRREKMEKYEKPSMEIVDLEDEVILTSGCIGGTSDPDEGPGMEDF